MNTDELPIPLILSGIFSFQHAPRGKEGHVVEAGFRAIAWINEDSARTTAIFRTSGGIRLGEEKAIELLLLCPEELKKSFSPGDVLLIGSTTFEMGTFTVTGQLAGN